jgi:hypothetical protein
MTPPTSDFKTSPDSLYRFGVVKVLEITSSSKNYWFRTQNEAKSYVLALTYMGALETGRAFGIHVYHYALAEWCGA